MSTIGLRDSDNFREKVIIRAAADEPVLLTAISMGEGAVDVVGEDESSPVAFHADRAFRYEQGTYRRMRRAYESGDTDALLKLWSQAEAFAPPVTA